MSMNVNYSYLFEQMFGVSNTAKDVASSDNNGNANYYYIPLISSELFYQDTC